MDPMHREVQLDLPTAPYRNLLTPQNPTRPPALTVIQSNLSFHRPHRAAFHIPRATKSPVGVVIDPASSPHR
jgi:hypothetical protein